MSQDASANHQLRVSFQEALDSTEANVQEQGELVLRALRGALNALWESDVELADEVVAFDDDIDVIYKGVQENIQSLLAQQTPVATDLRLVLALLHTSLHLERMGDYCVTIAKLTKLASDSQPDPELVDAFSDMGARAEAMIRAALDSFSNRDVDVASSLVELDELIDRANRRVLEQVFALQPYPERLEWGLRMINVSRCLERIGDHAVDVGEQVAYLVTGEFREFTDASRG
jgi:phosphate transport system protein